MATGYIITLVFAAIWIGFIVFENVKKHIDKRNAEKQTAKDNEAEKFLHL